MIRPEWIFNLWVSAAADNQIASMPDVTLWSPLLCRIAQWWANVRMDVFGALWSWK